MKKRFLPFSLLLVIMILGQSMLVAGNGGHYVPREKGTASAEAFMSAIRANQQTGLIDPALMLKAAKASNAATREDDLYWLSMGPGNFGGVTTSVIYDNRNNNVIYIGSMGGGVFKSNNQGTTWHLVGNSPLMVSCMAQAANGTIYVGTGDGDQAVKYNGLSALSYDNSFIGSGVYSIVNDVVAPLEATLPSSLNEATEWSFINDLAIVGNTLIAATESGLKYSVDNGATWTLATDNAGAQLNGNATQVKVGPTGLVIAAVEGNVYLGAELSALKCHSAATAVSENGVFTVLETAKGMLDVAAAPSNENVLYAACIGTNGKHTGVYVSNDKGATWEVALPANSSKDIYGSMGLYNHGLVVSPVNPHLVYVLGLNMWELKKPSLPGYYIATLKSTRKGMQSMTFNPRNSSDFFIGTNEGVFKFNGIEMDIYQFLDCNRNYVASKFLSVAPSGMTTRVMGGALDFGDILIKGNPLANHLNEGTRVFQAPGGPGAVSLIDSLAIFVSSSGKEAVTRSQTAGFDFDISNFSLPSTDDLFKTPILLWESFNSATNPASVWYFGHNDPAGKVVQCFSNNRGYPFDYTLPVAVAEGDSIQVHDPVASVLFVATKDALHMTRDAVRFDKTCAWWKIAGTGQGFKGSPYCLTISPDGDHVFAGTTDGKFYRVSNINAAIDSASTILSDSNCVLITTVITLPVEGQCVTSIAVDPRNANNVIVTLGNYGNNTYVLYSTDALSDAPTFTSKQANLPLMPVYSSVIEMTNGYVILGTEHGIFMTTDIASPNWVAQRNQMGDVPVMELKQQIVYHPDQKVVFVDAGTHDTIYRRHAGVKNQGIIYAATFGRGIFRCENYVTHSGQGIDNPTVATTQLSLYPNPVQNQAKLSFEMSSKANVAYQIFDMSGRMMQNVNLGTYDEGVYEVEVNANELATGAYLLRLSQGAKVSSVKFLVY